MSANRQRILPVEVCRRIIALMNDVKVEYDLLGHPPISESQATIACRKECGWTGAHCRPIMLKAKDRYHLVVTTCDCSINGRHFKKPFGTKNIRFARSEEIEEHSGCAIGSKGSLPPFLPGNRMVPHYFDLAILASENFMFFLAANTISVRIKSNDLYKLLTASGTKAFWFSRNTEERLDFFHHEELPRLRLSPPSCV
ncbi:hypothetical protein G3N56_02260 [Desulfovibrio sulfodismutans]|uniref:YbaK/aminoacyl-tRNA synthetase-associated domain-containing protein n=1 Tax=Desulfolutivibrio sulfodismutans TaxID=63561 RepID=A0A7K3NK21_9BACT|nr:YbaK/EbsC family protein [Desulfolutivibrio sulfodismutans]NDY55569.1 hypothetical protein [Desulfolutivibrio sulfodismutans]QLA11471.1 hypothetical protein GD606_03855 [Desulfolutivibrio sulfodismutans DSM 3696]